MKKLYPIGMGVVFLFILILSLPQVAATCSWYLPLKGSNPTLALMQATGLGAVFGGLSVFFWKSLKEPDDEDVGPEIGSKDSKPPQKMS